MIALVSPVWGSLSDSAGRKPVIVASAALLAVPTILGAFAPSFGVLLALRSLQGLLIPGLTAVAVALLGDHFHGAALPPKVAAWIGASVVGGLTGRVVSGYLAAWLDWHAPFVVFGVLTAAGAVGMALSFRQDRRPPAAPSGVEGARRPPPEPAPRRRLPDRRRRPLRLHRGLHLPPLLPVRAPFGLSTAAVSSFYFAYVAGVVTSLLVPRLPERFSGRRLMAIGLSVAAAGVAGTLVRSVPPIGASLVVVCVGMFLVQATAPAFVNLNAASAQGGGRIPLRHLLLPRRDRRVLPAGPRLSALGLARRRRRLPRGPRRRPRREPVALRMTERRSPATWRSSAAESSASPRPSSSRTAPAPRSSCSRRRTGSRPTRPAGTAA